MQCTEKPDRVEVRQRPDGLADCFIRRNIKRIEDADGNEVWDSDEAQFTGSYTLAMVEEHEDELWLIHKPVPIGERIAATEAAQAAQDDAIIELYEMLIGE